MEGSVPQWCLARLLETFVRLLLSLLQIDDYPTRRKRFRMLRAPPDRRPGKNTKYNCAMIITVEEYTHVPSMLVGSV